MTARIEETSTITAKGQTTVPKTVRKALGVDYPSEPQLSIGTTIANSLRWR